jgi:hypothetical protein
VKIVFSRKGFDSTFGGAPSPIVAGRPVSLPIPASRSGKTPYAALGLGGLVEQATRGRMTGGDMCHDDPMFGDGYCWLGQAGAAQGHLRNQGVGPGDTFVFFGLFAQSDTGERHHRIFGAMEVTCHGPPGEIRGHAAWREPPRRHPHFEGAWDASNTIYHGPGRLAAGASDALRLTRPGGPLNRWIVPEWLKRHGLTYHARPERWIGANELDSAKRGQEFVCDIGNSAEPRRWLEAILAEMLRA